MPDAPSNGLSFEFLADTGGPKAQFALTGHQDGVITISIAEADDAERERRRLALYEPYRTYVLNNLNRGLGLPDGYPFVLSIQALDKMRFIHNTISAAAIAITPALAPTGTQ